MLKIGNGKMLATILLSLSILLCGSAIAETFSYTEFMLTAGDPMESAEFGRSVAMDGNVIVVGAAEGSDGVAVGPGAAYVFRRIDGTWVQEAKLTGPGLDDGAEFGRDVDVKGDTIVVGARFASTAAAEQAGAAFVYKRKRGCWTFDQMVAPDDGAAEDNFGRAVALAHDLLVVSARKEDIADENDGAVYVFKKRGRRFHQTAKLTASDGSDGARFGQSLHVERNLIVVGARDATNSLGDKAGAVYLFRRIGCTWVAAARLEADDGVKGDQFGFNVAMAGGTIAVGSRRSDPEDVTDAGAVYLYVWRDGGWVQADKLTAADAAAGDEFGHSVAMSGGTIAVGARRADIGENKNQGAVYLFRRSPDGWRQADKITAYNGQAGDEFAHSLAAHGNRIAVGANVADFDALDQGAAYVYQPWHHVQR